MAISISEVPGTPSSGNWFIEFLKDELKPYPGRWTTVSRMVLTAVLTMLVVMTLRSPNSAIGIFFGLTISRENPASTIKDGLKTILAFIAGLVYVLAGVTIFINDQLPHFIFIALSLAIMFFVMRTLKSYSAAFGFCFVVVTALPIWDLPFPVDEHVDNNIWAVFGVILSVGITIAVELLLSPHQKATEEIRKGITHRLSALQALLQAYLEEKDVDSCPEREEVKQLARLGTGRLKRYLARSAMDDASDIRKAQWAARISVSERLIDTASSLGTPRKPLTMKDKSRLQALWAACEKLKDVVKKEEAPPGDFREFAGGPSRALPLLSELEQKFEQLPHAQERIETYYQRFNLKTLDWRQYFVADAFRNVEYLHFAVKGTLAGLVCYIFYSSVDWHGLGNSLATCVITALSTVGSSRQKQVLRIGGAIFGGLILGLGSQIFILPNLDSIFGFTVLFTLVTALSAWITTASTRFSYFGLQMALAFYLIMFQSAAIEISLDIARDRVMGTLAGLLVMWWIFDHLWTKPGIREMKDAFAENMRNLGELATTMLRDSAALERMNILRERIHQSFGKMDENADMILFESGSQRARHLKWRSEMKSWQHAQEDLLLAQLTINHYRSKIQISDWPINLHEALIKFNSGLNETWSAIALAVTQNQKPDFQEGSLRPLLLDLRKEAMTYFNTESDRVSIHDVEAILELDEQIVAITETLVREVSAGSDVVCKIVVSI